MKEKKKMLGNGLLLLTAFIWGTAFVFQRAGMDRIEPLTFNAARMAISAVVIGTAAFFLWRRRWNFPSTRTEEELGEYKRNTFIGGICCGIFLALGSIFQQMGLVYTTAGKAGFITAMYVLIVPVISFIFFRKRYTWPVWLAVLMGVAGMYLLCISGKFALARGDALICVSAVVFSCHILCCDHFVERGNAIAISAIQFATVTVISSVAAVIAEKPGIDKLISAALPIIYCGIVSGGIGYTLQIVAQRFTDPTIASLLMSMESVFAVITGAVILNEHMSVRELSGCVIMFAAIVLAQIPRESS